jgi:hypothetical protein
LKLNIPKKEEPVVEQPTSSNDVPMEVELPAVVPDVEMQPEVKPEPQEPAAPPSTPFSPSLQNDNPMNLASALFNQQMAYHNIDLVNQAEAQRRDLRTSLVEGRKPRNKSKRIGEFAPELLPNRVSQELRQQQMREKQENLMRKKQEADAKQRESSFFFENVSLFSSSHATTTSIRSSTTCT